MLFSNHNTTLDSCTDQDTIVIYNSLLVANNIQQEYLDHPSYSLFLVNAIFLKFLDFFGLIKINFIKEINEIEDFDNKFQSIFYILKIINLMIFSLTIFIFKKIMKILDFSFSPNCNININHFT